LGRRDEENARAARDQDAKSEYDAKIAEKTRIVGPLPEKRLSERSGRKQREVGVILAASAAEASRKRSATSSRKGPPRGEMKTNP
jgi:hypothetical protein